MLHKIIKKERESVMKKTILTMLLAVVICVTGFLTWQENVCAEVACEDVNMECLWTEDAKIGYAQNQTWGVYLSDGYSIINKISSTKVGAGGATNAAMRCTVRVTSILERKNSSGSWVRVTSWTQTNENAVCAMISKSVTVSSGYYYRVRSNHYASTDSASSYTDALWIGN